jgi:hypothetical protein
MGLRSWYKDGFGSEFMPMTIIKGMNPKCAATFAFFIAQVLHSLAHFTAVLSSLDAAEDLFRPDFPAFPLPFRDALLAIREIAL